MTPNFLSKMSVADLEELLKTTHKSILSIQEKHCNSAPFDICDFCEAYTQCYNQSHIWAETMKELCTRKRR